jgi:hypothetical protein
LMIVKSSIFAVGSSRRLRQQGRNMTSTAHRHFQPRRNVGMFTKAVWMQCSAKSANGAERASKPGSIPSHSLLNCRGPQKAYRNNTASSAVIQSNMSMLAPARGPCACHSIR